MIGKRINYYPKGVDVVDFVRIMLNIIPHKEEITFFLAMAIIDIFKEISEKNGMITKIYLRNFTNRVCDVTIK